MGWLPMYNKIKHIYCNIEIRLYLYWTWYTIIAFGVDVRCGWTYRGDRPSCDECRGWWRWTRDWRSSESWRRRPCSAARYSADRRWTLQWNISTVPTAPARHSPSGAYRYNTVSYTHLRAHETVLDLVCRLLLEKKIWHGDVSHSS